MPFEMLVQGKTRDVPPRDPMAIDEEWAQNVMSCFAFEVSLRIGGKRRKMTFAKALSKLVGADVSPLERISDGCTSIEEYLDIDVDPVSAEEALERNRAAWQRPGPLLAALRAALPAFVGEEHRDVITKIVEPYGHQPDDFRIVIEDLVERTENAIAAGATEVCLVLDASLL